MEDQKKFMEWLEGSTNLSTSTIEKYVRAINTISKELKEEGLLEQSLFYINNPVMIEKYKMEYLTLPKYHAKDTRGNRMYSNALKYYHKYIQANQEKG